MFIPSSLAGLPALSRIRQAHPTWVATILPSSLQPAFPSSSLPDRLQCCCGGDSNDPILFLFYFFISETGLHCISKTGLEFPSSCLNLWNAGIADMYHHSLQPPYFKAIPPPRSYLSFLAELSTHYFSPQSLHFLYLPNVCLLQYKEPQDWSLCFVHGYVPGQWNGARLTGRTQEIFAEGTNTPQV